MESIVDVIGYATREDWDKVDALLPELSNQQLTFSWAGANLRCGDLNIRDLAASIMEQTEMPLQDANVVDLFWVMSQVEETNPYPSFRAACALAKRRADERIAIKIAEVKDHLQNFTEDEDVSEIAQDYLGELAA
jgi:hypothetical protein